MGKTIPVSDEIHSMVKAKAKKSGKHIKEVAEEALMKGLEQSESSGNDLVKSTYEYTRSATQAFFDGFFESLEKRKDLIVELAERISKALNPIPHAIARAIEKFTDAILKKFEEGEVTVDQLFNVLIPLLEVYLQSNGKGSIIANLKALYVSTQDRKIVGVSLDNQQETSDQSSIKQGVASNS